EQERPQSLSGPAVQFAGLIAFRVRHVIVNDSKSFVERHRLWGTAARTATLLLKVGHVAPRSSLLRGAAAAGTWCSRWPAQSYALPQLSATSRSDLGRR
ncbi:MAG: hypothetical protein M1815_004927, partial [Lichina confinis]